LSENTQAGGAPSGSGVIRWVTRLLDWSAAIVLFATMALAFGDVVSRELLNEPFPFTTDATRLMLAAMVYAVLPVVTRLEQHVCVDLLDRWVPASWVRPRQAVINLFAAAIFGFMCWQIAIQAYEKWDFNDLTQFMNWDLWPIYLFMSVMSGLTAIGLLINAYLYAVGRPPATNLGGVTATD
jgi:TRAP-type C4-dicarboxylate transport system permease small subunit